MLLLIGKILKYIEILGSREDVEQIIFANLRRCRESFVRIKFFSQPGTFGKGRSRVGKSRQRGLEIPNLEWNGRVCS